MPSSRLLAPKLFSVPRLKCVVTGGGTGIGLTITQALAANGATVYIIGRYRQVLGTTAAECGGNIVPIAAGPVSADSIEHLATQVAEQEPFMCSSTMRAGLRRTDDELLDWLWHRFSNAGSIRAQLSKATPESWAETFWTSAAA